MFGDGSDARGFSGQGTFLAGETEWRKNDVKRTDGAPPTHIYRLLDRLEARTIVLADKAYDAEGIRDLIDAQGAVPNLSAKSNRKWKPCFSKVLYRERRLGSAVDDGLSGELLGLGPSPVVSC